MGIFSAFSKRDPFEFASPLLARLEPNTIRKIIIWLLKDKVWKKQRQSDEKVLSTTVWSRKFPNPIGIAAGFDASGTVIDEFIRIGFGFGEIGTITLEPDKITKRAYKLRKDEAIIYQTSGFNNIGSKKASMLLAKRRGRKGVVGVSIGENVFNVESIDEAERDIVGEYDAVIRAVAPFADYVVINISNSYMESLAEFQLKESLDELLRRLRLAVNIATPIKTPPLLLKMSSDINNEGKRITAEMLLKHKFDGLIVGGSTGTRPETLVSKRKDEPGGLCGKPIMEKTTQLLREMYKHTNGQIPIIGVGGITSGADAYEKIRAGASLVQIYTSVIIHGPMVIKKIKKELAELLKADGYKSVSEAVGADINKGS
ncbi:MAG: dihydroorotate dehydrogenase (quinone) [Alphaproteobacteria bacterium]|nr:dihydroorotate dehydrogenase (quinone) [Alphaproteobacteria bacterium]